MLTLQSVINTQILHDCLENAKLESKNLGEQNIILELQVYLLKIDVLLAANNSLSDWRSKKLSFDKILRKLISFSKQIESLINVHILSEQDWPYEVLEQTKKLIPVIRESASDHI